LDVFDYSHDFAAIDFRHRPDLYRIGKGEQGVLLDPDLVAACLVTEVRRTPTSVNAFQQSKCRELVQSGLVDAPFWLLDGIPSATLRASVRHSAGDVTDARGSSLSMLPQ
jgi:hypothetical protein